jgi:heme/copper-type cytochrome/quinol oxidase subunit 3
MLGTLCFLAAEGMFFLGLVFVALSIRSDSVAWPPADAPALDPVIPLVNTLILLVSSATAHLGGLAIRRGDSHRLVGWFAGTLALGGLFLGGQVAEFIKLGGWRPWEGQYRALFDTVVGLHGLHVLAGLVLLALILLRARRGHFDARRNVAVVAVELYWQFVTAAWLILFAVLLVA